MEPLQHERTNIIQTSKLFLVVGDNTSPSQNSVVHYQTQKNPDDTSSCIVLLNFWSSLSKIHANLPHCSDMVGTARKSKNSSCKTFKKYTAASPQIPHHLCKAACVLIGWLFHSDMARMKVTSTVGWRHQTKMTAGLGLGIIPLPQVKWSGRGRRVEKLEEVGTVARGHCPLDRWCRWPQRQGHQCSVGEEPAQKNFGWPWEARPPERSFWSWPVEKALEVLAGDSKPSLRSASSRRALSSS